MTPVVLSRLGITVAGVGVGAVAAWLAVLVSTQQLLVCASAFPPAADCSVDDESVAWGWDVSVALAGCTLIAGGIALAWLRPIKTAASVVAFGAAVALAPFVVSVAEFGWPRNW